MQRKTLVGLVAVVGVWLTAGLALPMVNVLKQFSPEQLLTARGFLTALMAFVLAKGKVTNVDKWTWYIALVIPFASLGLFKGVREWGAAPTIIIVTATPLVNFLLTVLLGKKVSKETILALFLVLGGVIVARWGGGFQALGFAWAVFGTVCNGILYELFARAKSTPFQRCFWACMGIGIVGLVGSYHSNWVHVTQDPLLPVLLVGFAFVGGFLYWLANLYAFENLDKDAASVLAQGETPVVILFAGLMLGEHLTLVQWLGVFIALYGAWYLSRRLAKKDRETTSGTESATA